MSQVRSSPVGIIAVVLFGIPFIGVGLAAFYFAIAQQRPSLGVVGVIFAGVGISQVVSAFRRGRSAESQAAVAHQSATIRDVLPPTNVDYRTAARSSFTALDIYGRILNVAPLPIIETRPGLSLPVALPLRDDSGGIAGIIFGLIFLVVGVFMGTVAFFSEAGSGLIMSAIFALVGALILIFLVKKRLARMKLPHVEMSAEPVFVGDPFRLHITQVGPAKITRLRVDLSCKEHVTYRVGTNTRNETNEIYSQELLDDPGETLRSGERWPHDLLVQIPPNYPATFKSKNNAIAWTLRVRAEIVNWPDYDEVYELRALPKPVGLQ